MEFLETNEWNPDERVILLASQMLKSGAVGIIPTDSIYALVCDLSNKKGIEQICKLIGKKPERAKLSVLFSDFKQIAEYTQAFDTSTFKILKRNLPGPFTFILKANSKIPKIFMNNRKTLGIRIPDSATALRVIDLNKTPLVSASVHSEDEIQDYLTDPEEILESYNNKVDFILSDGSGGNQPSTIVDLTDNEVIIIRQGKGQLL